MREPSYYPVHAYQEAGPKRAGRVRRQTASRMQALRQRQREAGRPDATALNRAIADALRDAIASTVRDGVAGAVDPQAIILGIAEHLRLRTERARAAGKTHVVYRREAVSEAIFERLLAPKTADT